MAIATVETAAPPPMYPVRLWMTYPEKLSRWATFFRIFLIIPVLLFVALLGGGALNFSQWDSEQTRNGGIGGAAGGGLVVAVWITILLRRNIPRWLFDFQVAVHRFTYRAGAYIFLLVDRYPAFEGDWDLQYWVDYPERPSRWKLVFWKIITAIPHFFVLAVLSIAALIVVIIAWFAILFTGKYPRGMHDFVVGVMRWYARVSAYVESLTDAFPPYSLDHDAGPGSKSAETISAIIGAVVLILAAAAAAAAITFFVIFLRKEESRDVAYDDVIGSEISAELEIDDVTFTLITGADPADNGLIFPREGSRLVGFVVRYQGEGSNFTFGTAQDVGKRDIERDTLRLQTDGDSSIDPVLLTFDGSVAPFEVDDEATGEIVVIFEIDEDDTPEELRAYPNADANGRHVAWQFE